MEFKNAMKEIYVFSIIMLRKSGGVAATCFSIEFSFLILNTELLCIKSNVDFHHWVLVIRILVNAEQVMKTVEYSWFCNVY